jgi:hypothetical protein
MLQSSRLAGQSAELASQKDWKLCHAGEQALQGNRRPGMFTVRWTLPTRTLEHLFGDSSNPIPTAPRLLSRLADSKSVTAAYPANEIMCRRSGSKRSSQHSSSQLAVRAAVCAFAGAPLRRSLRPAKPAATETDRAVHLTIS